MAPKPPHVRSAPAEPWRFSGVVTPNVRAAPAEPWRPSIVVWYDRRAMAQRLPELIGRAMIDPDFLADLQRAPETILAQYELSADERSTVLRALARLAQTPTGQRAQAFQSALIRRVST